MPKPQQEKPERRVSLFYRLISFVWKSRARAEGCRVFATLMNLISENYVSFVWSKTNATSRAKLSGQMSDRNILTCLTLYLSVHLKGRHIVSHFELGRAENRSAKTLPP